MDYQRLATTRKRRGLSQTQLAEMIGTTQQNLSRYESGIREPKATTLATIAKALDVSWSYLLGITDDEHAEPVPAWDDVLKIDEKNLLGLFRHCNQEWKHYVLQAARIASEQTRRGESYFEPLGEEELKDA